MEVQINELKEKRRKGKTPFTQHGARQNLPIREIHEEKKRRKKEIQGNAKELERG